MQINYFNIQRDLLYKDISWFMPYNTTYLLWEEDYLQRENELMDFIRYVPPGSEHEKVWSLKLANQLLLIGSSIDSIFKMALKEHVLSSINEYKKFKFIQSFQPVYLDKMDELYQRILISEKKKTGSRKYRFINMNDYREIFEEKYNNFSQHPVFFPLTKQKINPFECWANDKSPIWWNVYTDLKHSRVKNRKSATIEQVLNALAALFLLNVYFPVNRKYLAINGVIKYNLNQGQDWLISELDQNHIKTNPSGFVPIAKTNLFAYLFDDDHTWHIQQNAWLEIDPYNTY